MKNIQVSHIPGLRVIDTLSFYKKKIDIESYLPEFKDSEMLAERIYVCNLNKFKCLITISDTLFPAEFKSFMMKTVREKRKSMYLRRKWKS